MSKAPDPTFNTTLPVDNGEFGVNQRLYFEIPKPPTALLLGYRYHLDGDPQFGYSGIVARTDEHLFADIKKKTLYQGTQSITLQTADVLRVYSTLQSIHYAAKNHDTTSATAVVISSAPPPANRDPAVGADMKPLFGEELPDVASYVSDRDDLLGEQKTAIDDAKGKHADADGAHTDVGGAAIASDMDTVSDNLRDLNQSTLSSSTAESGATHAGIGLVSKDSIGLWSSTKTVAWGKTGIVMMAGDSAAADIYGFATGNLLLRAADKTEIVTKNTAYLHGAKVCIAGKEDTSIGSRTSNAIMLGTDIFIGRKDGTDKLSAFSLDDTSKQKDTDNVTIEVKTKALIDSDDKIEAEAANKITLTVGDYVITVGTSSIKLDNGAGGKVELTSSKIELDLSGSNIKVEASGITISSGGSELKVGASGVSANGSMVKLG